MTAALPLAPVAVPLDGTTLVEAAAGTGKTRAITDLHLRLVLERGLTVERILVITFTRAATAELRQRIRARLRDACAALAGRAAAELAPAPELVERAGGAERAARLLEAAVRSMDEAAVYTIHGFCQRAIEDHAFAGGLPVERELVADRSALLLEVVADFWRRERASLPLELAARCADMGPAELAAWVRAPLAHPRQRVVGPAEHGGADLEPGRLERARVGLAARWGSERDAAEALIERASLDRRRYRADWVRGWFERIDAWLRSGTAAPGQKVVDALVRLAPERIGEALRDGPAPDHPLLACCAELAAASRAVDAAYAVWERGMRVRLIEHCREEIARRQREHAALGYDDLLSDLAAALAADDGRLAAALRARYPAALVDEFQDTDPLQLEVLDGIYRGGDCPLLLVGDPKQAIYRFRGADVFAYLAARRDADRVARLATNYRSTPALIDAVNALFGESEHPFALPGIGFAPVAAAGERPPLALAGEAHAALRVWRLDRDPDARPGKARAAGEAVTLAATATAADIAALIEAGRAGDAHIGADAVTAGDIAVLVRSHRQGREVAAALARHAVPFARRGQDDVFASDEAEELERLLGALLAPHDGARMRAVLGGALFGLDAAALLALDDGDAAGQWAEQFWEWRQRWADRGVLAMFLDLIAGAGVAERVLASGGGERALTNLRHLAELLDQAARDGGLGPGALLAWLARRRGGARGEDREAQLRLERDGDAVQILTIHGAKGLEFPIVYFPFAWDPGRAPRPGEGRAFHDPQGGGAARLWIGDEPPAAIEARAALEDLAENLRLLYVALTRARARCTFGWGAIAGAERSALAWLLHPPVEPGAEPAAALAAQFEDLGDDAIAAALDRLAARAAGAIAVEALPRRDRGPLAPAAAATTEPRARSFGGRIHTRRERASFTSLGSGAPGGAADRDALDSALGEAPPAAGERFAFPRGARAGVCLHAVLERADPAPAARAALPALVADLLPASGFEREWAGGVARWIGEVLDTPIAALGDAPLAALPASERVAELEFHFAADTLAPEQVRACAAECGLDPRWLAFASERPIHGLVNGYIDLVARAGQRYFVIDYKSNWLGARVEDYAPQRTADAVREHGYTLQYLLYTVALHRHIASRVPGYRYERDFGGVCYLFLRGMAPHFPAGNGMFFERPPAALIDALDRIMGQR